MLKRYERSGLKVIEEQRFLRLCEVSYRHVDYDVPLASEPKRDTTKDMKWEVTQRIGRQMPLELCQKSPVPIAVDGVEICAFLQRVDKTFLILVAQYRPPVDAVVLEFPAGLIDPGEDVKTAALRELREETGYFASEEDIVSVTNPLCYEPGMTDSFSQTVKIIVDGGKVENCDPEQKLDDGEDIEVFLLPLGSKGTQACSDTPIQLLEDILQEKNKTQRTVIDARLYMFLDGLSLARTMAR